MGSGDHLCGWNQRNGPQKVLEVSAGSKAFKTIGHATKAAKCGDTIQVLPGLYTNDNYGKSDDNDAVVTLTGLANLKIIGDTSDPTTTQIKFDGAGGFVGGSKSKPVTYLEIAGFEIVGPNQEITFEEAMEHRLDGVSGGKYNGRGVAVWGSGHHIHIHDMIVSYTPAAGLRVNYADYVVIEHSKVFGCTWWSAGAESGIVLASSTNIDEEKDKLKMSIRYNEVHDNRNQIPYYNKKYEYNYSPIGSSDCEQDACKNWQMDCPWDCRYGKKTQDYIIDGQGVYVTRNDCDGTGVPEGKTTCTKGNDCEYVGKMELSHNIAYRNGINGVTFHRTPGGGVMINNTIYNNGQVPKTNAKGWKSPTELKVDAKANAHAEPEALDWHEGCKGKTRQPYSGLAINESPNVVVLDNKIAARYSDDYAMVMQMDGGHDPYPVEGTNNIVCNGIPNLVNTDGSLPYTEESLMSPEESSVGACKWLETACADDDYPKYCLGQM